ncbi:unnamed protein product [Amoebophrya sp. A25]|nr:unnamed protein product [Amoebophrya sp. A25]|eukprot:GSA25T00027607001.1
MWPAVGQKWHVSSRHGTSAAGDLRPWDCSIESLRLCYSISVSMVEQRSVLNFLSCVYSSYIFT